MDIASWNVNSIRARQERVAAWIDRRSPAVVCLQETKVEDGRFPKELFEDRGYQVAVFGQRTYNGVAIAAREPLRLEAVERGLPGDGAGDQRRVIAATVGGIRVVNVYAPNGGEVGSDKYAFKLAWYEHLRESLQRSACADVPLVVCGDFNVAPKDEDVFDPDRARGLTMFTEREKEALRRLTDIGLADVLRHFTREPGLYTWWDYRRLGFQKDKGWRIDHFLANPSALERASGVEIDRDERKGNQPSDHAPIIATFRS